MHYAIAQEALYENVLKSIYHENKYSASLIALQLCVGYGITYLLIFVRIRACGTSPFKL